MPDKLPVFDRKHYSARGKDVDDKSLFFSSPSNVFLGELSHPDAYNLEYIPWKLRVVSKTSAGESNLCSITFIIQSHGMKQRLKRPRRARCLSNFCH